ncbi:MAG: CDP-alcohol phosphatidyltransferase family protein [Chlamydiales bacterium]|nr:CDP-alcohol phosphatidyltransferase family protein [Chlamydiales bacterium]
MITTSNLLTFIRGPLAFLFLFHSPFIRLVTLLVAMITDSIDGYIARKWRATSRFGAVLDPIMDKFFVFFVLSVFIFEHKMQFWQAAIMLSRDIALFLFFLYLIISSKFKSYKFRPANAGKISTALQFILLVAITLNYFIPAYVYYIFAILGVIVLGELFYKIRSPITEKPVK